MHRSTQPPELLDAWLPPRAFRSARLERLIGRISAVPARAAPARLINGPGDAYRPPKATI